MAVVSTRDVRPSPPKNVGFGLAPQNLGAEQALLGMLLYDNGVYEHVSNRLNAKDFYEPFHARLYRAIERRILEGQLAEPILLANQLKHDPAFEKLGGLRYLADLVDCAPRAAKAPEYARAIHDDALRRAGLGESSSGSEPVTPVEGGWLNYVAIFRAEPLARIRMVKAGLSAVSAKQIISDLDMRGADAAEALDVPISTINRKAKNQDVLSRDESERFIGLARLIGQVQAMVEESGDPTGFDAQAWTARWLSEPLPAFGGERPIDYMDTMEGQTLVANMLARIQSGAYA